MWPWRCCIQSSRLLNFGQCFIVGFDALDPVVYGVILDYLWKNSHVTKNTKLQQMIFKKYFMLFFALFNA